MSETDSAKGKKMLKLFQREAMTTSEAAELLEISLMQVTREFHSGHIEGYRKGSGLRSQIMVYKDSVIEFAKKVQGRSVSKSSKNSQR